MYECFFSVAPMMGLSDRHCRYFHRLLSKRARLYSEMIVADAIIYGDESRFLQFNESEHPVALQLGGSEAAALARAAKIAARWGYDEINLNVGCPSSRVQSGTFGACLMRQPKLVGECVGALKQAVAVPVTVKCRLGVDEQDIEESLDNLAAAVFANGCDGIWVHARKAILQGLNPKQNRNVPPLNYERVIKLKENYGNKFIGLNGGIETFKQIDELWGKVDGFMVGRHVFKHPIFLSGVDERLFNEGAKKLDYEALCQEIMRYGELCLAQGVRLPEVVRPLFGLFNGVRGARQFRRILSENVLHYPFSVGIIEQAFSKVLTQNEGVL